MGIGIVTGQISAPILIANEQDVNDFDSGQSTLDEWLRRKALKNQLSGASRCFVVCEESKVIGYYTLSAGAIAHENAPKKFKYNMPDPLPILLLGRLAIDKNYQNIGLGKALLRDALLRTIAISKNAGVFAILVHALTEQAKRFYLSRGFVESPIQPMTLMMTTKTIRSILGD